MIDGGIQSMKNSVALMMRHGIEPPCELIARTCGLEDVELVRAEVARIKALVPPNTDTGCEAK